MAGVLKKTTGLTGLAVAKNPHYSLSILYTKLLRALQGIPESAAYRRYTEEIVKERMALVESEKDVAKLEAKIGAGQIEQVIRQVRHRSLHFRLAARGRLYFAAVPALLLALCERFTTADYKGRCGSRMPCEDKYSLGTYYVT
ncbi:hypothetical protein HPB47_004560 [Ixodes persulcatus]|uniref:Uncharacterized protein n=1 Tax=Ixodes persulcatus TaxID=34615 RepID=A0AC60PFC8_IXOPE|nr:hypothetical protein HPB47_004560 [Ixodes persulcatus]